MPSWSHILFESWFWKEALKTVLVIFAAWVAARIYILLVDRAGRIWVRRTVSDLDDRILAAVRKPGSVLVFLIGVYAAFHRYTFRLLGTLDGLIFILSVGIVIAMLIKLSDISLQWYAEKLRRERKDETLAREMLPLADKIVTILLLLIGLMVVLDRFQIDIKSILVTLGVGSLAVGLALQDTLANMFGGFTIMLDRPFRVGDRIQLQTGETGDVESIGIRSTTVLMTDGNLLIIPNAVLVKTLVINHSFPDNSSLVHIELGVAYGSDAGKVKGLMLEAVGEDARIMPTPAPAVFFKSFAESALSFVLYCYAKNFADVMAITDQLNTAIDAKFRAAGIDMPFPIRTVYLHDESRQGAAQRRSPPFDTPA